MNLRYYQREAIESTLFAWCEMQKVVGKIGTGGGKTIVAAGIIDQERDGRTLFLADQNELCQQPRERIREFAGIIPALEKAEVIAPLQAQVVVASSQTLKNPERLSRYPKDHFSRIVIDEAHRGTERDMVIASRFPDARVLGLTATPFRKNLADLSKWYDGVAFEMGMLDLVDTGFAPPIKVATMPVEIDLERVRTSRTTDGSDYNLEDLDTAIAPYYEEVARQIKERYSNRHIICFLPLIKSSVEFTAILRSFGLPARHVDGNSKDRAETIAGFSHGEFNIICNSEVLSTGIDIPIADAILDLSPTSSSARYQQRVGRIMRPLPGYIDHLTEEDQNSGRIFNILNSPKPDALIIDIICQNDRLASMHAAHLVADSEEEAIEIFAKSKRCLDPIELNAIRKQVQQEKEAQLIEAIDRAAVRSGGKSFNAYHVGALLNDDRLKNYTPLSRREQMPATEPQLKYISSFGVDPSTVDCFGVASQLLTILPVRRSRGMATLKQVQVLKRAHRVQPERYTLKEATREISAIFSERKQRNKLRGVL
jgi:superfamily II DNA or RNA helicase